MVTQQQQQPAKTNLPAVAPPRLPYDPRVKDRFGVDQSDWKALVEVLFPSAKTAGAVILMLAYCRARKLDPFKRSVHIVSIWDKDRKCYVETVWPGIAEHRTTAFRTGIYAGHDPITRGPMIEKTWKDGDGDVTVSFPEWAQMTVYRLVAGERYPFPGPVVYWIETYADKKSGAPNSMWADRPIGMLDKCAEAAALRGAFPEELGDEFTEVEASQRFLNGRAAVVVESQQQTSRSAQARLPGPAPTVDFSEQSHSAREQEEAHAETVAAEQPADSVNSEPHPESANEPSDTERAAEIVEEYRLFLEGCNSVIECNAKAKEAEEFAATSPWFTAEAVDAVKTMARAKVDAIHAQRGGRGNGGAKS